MEQNEFSHGFKDDLAKFRYDRKLVFDASRKHYSSYENGDHPKKNNEIYDRIFNKELGKPSKIVTLKEETFPTIVHSENKPLEVSSHDYPWLAIFNASVLMALDPLRCLGALIAPRWVLTSAECFNFPDLVSDRTVVIVQVPVTVCGDSLWTQAAFFTPERGPLEQHSLALVRLERQPRDSSRVNGILDIAQDHESRQWKKCSIFSLGRMNSVMWGNVDHRSKADTSHLYSLPVMVSTSRNCSSLLVRDTSSQNSACVRALMKENPPCTGNPGSPAICEDGLQRPVMVAVAGANEDVMFCEGKANYWNAASFRNWTKETINAANKELLRSKKEPFIRALKAQQPVDPYLQRLRSLEEDLSGSSPARVIPGTITLLRLLTAASCVLLRQLSAVQ